MKFRDMFFLAALIIPGLSQTPAPSRAIPDAGAPRHAGRIYVDGVNYPLTQAGIQRALDDACARNPFGTHGTEVLLPPMVVVLSHKSGEQLLESCSLQIRGAGLYSTWFVVEANVPEDVPVFRIKPVAKGSQGAMSFEDFQITGKNSGGDAFLLDGSSPEISGPNHLSIRKVMVKGLSRGAWALNMVGKPFPKNQQGWSRISDSILDHGIRLTLAHATDSWLIEHNNFGSATGGATPCIDATTVEGAAHITAFNNNGGCAGGFFITHGTTQCKVLYNQIEQPVASTEPNSAIIDLMGDAYRIDGCEIVGNNINAHTFAETNIRIGRATNTSIYDNVIALRPKSGVGILLTAASALTRIPFNEFLRAGDGAEKYRNESGRSNFALQGADGSRQLPAIGFMDEPNTGLFRSGQGRINFGVQGTNALELSSGGLVMMGEGGYCHAIASGAPSETETCVNQIAPGVVGIGRAPGANKSALLQSGNTVRVREDFVSTKTSFATVAGLSWKLPGALTYSFHCALSYAQAGGTSPIEFGIQTAGSAPVHLFANGVMQLGPTTFAGGTVPEWKDTGTAKIVSGSPSAARTELTVTLDGTFELATAADVGIKLAVGDSGKPVTIKKGSYCQLF